MPYDIDNPPSKLDKLSDKRKRQFIEVFNSCFEKHHDDKKCHMMAWGVVKKASQDEQVVRQIRAARLDVEAAEGMAGHAAE